MHKFATHALDQSSDPFALVSGEVVHHHYPSRTKMRQENSLTIGLEYRGVDRVGDCQRRTNAFNPPGFVLLTVDAQIRSSRGDCQ